MSTYGVKVSAYTVADNTTVKSPSTADSYIVTTIMSISPYQVAVADEALDQLNKKLSLTTFPDEVRGQSC